MPYFSIIKLQRWILIGVISFLSLQVNAQLAKDKLENEEDSLRQLLSKAKVDSNKVNILNSLSRTISLQNNFQEANKIALQAKDLAERIHYKKGIAASYASLGTIKRELNDLDQAFLYLNKALKICHSIGNKSEEAFVYDQLGHAYWAKVDTNAAITHHKKSLLLRMEIQDQIRIAHSCENLGFLFAKKSSYKIAFNYYLRALHIYEHHKDIPKSSLAAGNVGLMSYYLGDEATTLKYLFLASKYNEQDNNYQGTVWNFGLISGTYASLYDYESALKYDHKTLDLYLENDDEVGSATAYYSMGINYVQIKDFKKAKAALEKSLAIYEKHNQPKGFLLVKNYIGQMYYAEKKFELAKVNLEEALKLSIEHKHDRVLFISKKFLGATLMEMGQAEQANKFLKEALQFMLDTEAIGSLAFLYKNLAKTDSMMGNFESAFENYKLFVEWDDNKLGRSVNAEKLALKYEFEKKEVVAAAELKNKQLQRNAAIGTTILMIFITIIMIALFQLRSKKIKLDKENLELQKRDIENVKELEQFKSRFLTNITHEFRTPLTLINSHLEILKRENESPNMFRYKEMDQNGRRLLQLINRLLELSKMENGSYELTYNAGNAVKEINILVQSFHSMAAKRNIDIHLNVSDKLEKSDFHNSFYYSSEAISVMVSNLLSNAVKFTRENGNIYVNLDVEEDHLIIEVVDEGVGINEKHIDKIFNRFYQVDEKFNKTYEGSGIGLAFVKELSVLHGGNVTVSSVVNEGTKFKIWLKGAAAPTMDAEIIESEVVEFIETSEEIPSMNETVDSDLPLILVVEDHDDLRRFIMDNLSDDYRCIGAENGNIGVKMATEHVPDLIISDNMMPDMNGLQMCTTLKSDNATSHIPIIMLTAKADEEDRIEGLESGVDDYLTKPFSLAELKLRVRNILRLKEAIREKFEGSTSSISKLDDSAELSGRDVEFIGRLKEVVLNNLANKNLSVADLMDVAFLSQSQLTRKLKSIIGKTPADLIRTIRLESALQMLQKEGSVAEVGSLNGFDDPVYFSKVFKKHFGYPPSAYKKE